MFLQQEYIRGISAWNFNLEDLKSQAALVSLFPSLHLPHLPSSCIYARAGVKRASVLHLYATNVAFQWNTVLWILFWILKLCCRFKMMTVVLLQKTLIWGWTEWTYLMINLSQQINHLLRGRIIQILQIVTRLHIYFIHPK